METHRTTLIVCLLVLATAGTVAGAERSYVQPGLADGDGPAFSDAVRIGDTLYLSGAIGLDAERKVPAEPADEARLLLDSFAGKLAAAGFTMDDLVSVTVYCSDVKHYDVWNEVYRSYFQRELPARAFVGVGRLLFDARFEMQGIAVKRPE